jgi:pimeloyl-ACP methyl ester carboxylesterase
MSQTVVFIHGALNDHSVWDRQSAALAQQGFQVQALDLPGHGARPGPALDSVEAMAAWLLEELERLGVAQAALAGHSMGSLIALEAAARAPQRVTHLALLGTACPMRVSDALLVAALNDEPAAIAMVTEWSHSLAGHKAASQQLMERVAAGGEGLLHRDLNACKAYANGEAAAQAVRCPALILFGEKDMMTPPKAARRLLEALPQAQQATVDAGHQMMSERPDEVSAVLAQFLRG